jgi:hypothetical protein
VNGVKQLFCFETKEEAINYARPHLNNETNLIGALLFFAAFMINIYIIRRF